MRILVFYGNHDDFSKVKQTFEAAGHEVTGLAAGTTTRVFPTHPPESEVHQTPDIVFIDVEDDAVEHFVLPALTRSWPQTRIVAWTSAPNTAQFLRLYPHCFRVLPRPGSPELMLAVLGNAHPSSLDRFCADLTPCQKIAVRCVVEGTGATKELASRVGWSVRMFNWHLNAVFKRKKIHSKIELIQAINRLA